MFKQVIVDQHKFRPITLSKYIKILQKLEKDYAHLPVIFGQDDDGYNYRYVDPGGPAMLDKEYFDGKNFEGAVPRKAIAVN